MEFIKNPQNPVLTYEKVRLLESEMFNREQKITIAKTISTTKANMVLFADDISRFIIDMGVWEFPKEYVVAVMREIQNNEQTKKLLIACLSTWNDLDDSQINKLLYLVNSECLRVALSTRRASVSVNDSNYKIAELLKNKGYLRDYWQENDKIVFAKNSLY